MDAVQKTDFQPRDPFVESETYRQEHAPAPLEQTKGILEAEKPPANPRPSPNHRPPCQGGARRVACFCNAGLDAQAKPQRGKMLHPHSGLAAVAPAFQCGVAGVCGFQSCFRGAIRTDPGRCSGGRRWSRPGAAGVSRGGSIRSIRFRPARRFPSRGCRPTTGCWSGQR